MLYRTQYVLLAIGLAASPVAISSAMADGEPSAPASAREAPAAPAAPTEQVAWSGPWVGVGGGVGESGADIESISSVDEALFIGEAPKSAQVAYLSSIEIVGSIFERVGFGDGDWDGFGTVSLGYDRQFGNFVLGAFTDFDFYPDANNRRSKTLKGVGEISGCCSEVSATAECSDCGSKTFPLDARLRSDVHLDHVWNIGGRLGYLVRPNALLYVLGGYSRADLDGETTLTYDTLTYDTLFNRDGPVSVSVKAPDHLSGYFIGLGGEMFVRNNLSLKFEYRFAHYDGKRGGDSDEYDYYGGSEGGTVIDYERSVRLDTDIDADIHSVRGSLVFHLDHDRAPVQPLK